MPEDSFTIPIGEAAVAREGSDVTIVTISLSVQHSLDVAEQLEGEGISVEVIDPRSLTSSTDVSGHHAPTLQAVGRQLESDQLH